MLQLFEKLRESVLSAVYSTVQKIVKIHPIWAGMTVGLMFLPGVVFAPVALFACCLICCEEELGSRAERVAVCFFLPPVSLSEFLQSWFIPPGTGGATDWLTDIAVAFEAFLESAPQIMLQWYIVYHSGVMSSTQMISIFLSVVMLTKTAAMFEMV